MTDEIPTTTASSPQVSQPISGAKPYDDEIFEAYESDAPESNGVADGGAPEKGEAQANESGEAEDSTEDKEAESDEVKSEEADAKSKKGDQVDDGFEKVLVKKLINGKEVEFTVKQGIDAFVKQEEFNRNMDKRLAHVDNREKQVKSREQRWTDDQTSFKSKVDKVIDVAQKGDFITSIRALAKLAAGDSGLDVVQFEKSYFEQLDKVRDLYAKMTPEQREAYFAKRSAAEAQAKAKKLEEKDEFRSSKDELITKVSTLQKDYQVPDNEFWMHYGKIAENLTGEGKPFKTPNDIEPEDVIRYALTVRHHAKIFEAGERLGVTDDEVLDEVSRVTAAEPDLSIEDIMQVIKDAGLASKVADSKAVENLNRKAAKANHSRPNSTASSAKKTNGKVEGLDDEDLSFLYRNSPKVFSRPTR